MVNYKTTRGGIVSDWVDEVGDRSDDERKARRLANAISRLPGCYEEKVAFLVEHMALLEAEADREGAESSKRRAGVIVSLAFRYWRTALKGGINRAESQDIQIRDELRKKHGEVTGGPADRRERQTTFRLVPGSRNR